MKKNLKKVLKRIYLNSKEIDVSKRTFVPTDYTKNWNGAIKYLNAKDKRLTFNKIFKPLFKELLAEDMKVYLAGGHKLTASMKKELKVNAKQKATEITKTQLTIKAAV